MKNSFSKILKGYQNFRKIYALSDKSVMQHLSDHGQKPEIMMVSCCDSRVDPAVILQCDPGDLFVVRNVANIVPPFEKDKFHHGTSAALEFGICFLKVKHLILLGHSQCGGIQAILDNKTLNDDFITNWVSIVKDADAVQCSTDDYAKMALHKSASNCLSFPWINTRVQAGELRLHLWFFDIKMGQIFTFSEENQTFEPLDSLTQVVF